MATKSTTSNVSKSENKPVSDTPPRAETKQEEPEHLGTHPDSFHTYDLERDFKPTDDADLDEPGRWLSNEFFAATGPTTVVRLDELTNLGDESYEGRGDCSDRELAAQIIMRAGLGDHPRFRQLVDMMAVGLSEVEDPGDWLHRYGYNPRSSKRSGSSSNKSESSSG